MTIARLRKGAHEASSPRKWPKRLAWTAGIIILMAASAAAAFLFSLQLAAPDEISARSVGEVDIGDAATLGMFEETLEGLDLGDIHTSCVNAVVDGQEPEDEARLYVEQGGGDLADDLHITVRFLDTSTDVETPGHQVCEPGGAVPYSTLFDGTLAELEAARSGWENGIEFPRGDNIQVQTILELPSDADAQATQGETATLQLAFENRGP